MFEYKFINEEKKEIEDIAMDDDLAEALGILKGKKAPEEEKQEGSVNKEMLSLLQDIANEMKEARERDREAEERDAVMLEKMSEIQEKIAEISQKQLSKILSQAERIAKAMMASGSDEALKINMQALTNTVTIDKEDLDKLLSDAYPTNRDIVEKVEARFMNLHNSLESLSRDLNVVNNNSDVQTRAILERVTSLRDTVENSNHSLANKIEGVRRSIPNRELY
ncbi:MAG: hypothetical protein JXO44_14285 [Clostridia bacterium]|nr:hypothetical protein [Clostridia bacterium]